jgi:hypothetical protein
MSQILPAMGFLDRERSPKTEGTAFGMKSVWLWDSVFGGCSMGDPDWPALLTDYEAALAQFEATSRALTTALMQPGGPNGETGALLSAEAIARDTVVLTRTRLMNAWRDADAALPHFMPPPADKHV